MSQWPAGPSYDRWTKRRKSLPRRPLNGRGVGGVLMPIISEGESHQALSEDRPPKAIAMLRRKTGTPPQHEKCQSLAQPNGFKDRGIRLFAIYDGSWKPCVDEAS